MNNNQILIREIIKQELEENKDYTDINSFFEFYTASQIMKEHELSDEEIQSCITGAGLDGGCDSIFIFLNNILVTEDFVLNTELKKDIKIKLHIIQSKNTNSFSEDAIMKWKTISENLLKFDNDISSFKSRYSEDVLKSFVSFKDILIHLIRFKPSVNIKFTYVTLASEVHKNVEMQAEELKDIIKNLFPSPTTSVDVEFVDSTGLMNMISTPTIRDFNISLNENPIAIGKERNYVTIISLKEYYKFIIDEKGNLKTNIFESNVRDYQGTNSVNSEIKETLENGNGENFWWLNNGITMLAADAHQPTGKELVVTDPEIVNGLQTSNEIYNYFNKNPQKLETDIRSVLVRIIVPEDEASRDRIILATNNQTSIPKSSLRVTDPIHWQIEMYFKNRGLYYDRRKNYYKNQGKKSHEIISVSFLAQCLITLLLEQPDQARARPSTLLTNDDSYRKLYEKNYPLEMYLNIAKIGKKIEKTVKNYPDITPSEKSDILFYVLYSTVYKILKQDITNGNRLTEIDINKINENIILNNINEVLVCYKRLGGNGRVAKGHELIEELKKEIDAS